MITMGDLVEKLGLVADRAGSADGAAQLLRECWRIFNIGQKYRLVRSPLVASLVAAHAEGEFSVEDLLKAMDAYVAEAEALVSARGVVILRGEGGFFWESERDASEDFPTREDAVIDAATEVLAQ